MITTYVHECLSIIKMPLISFKGLRFVFLIISISCASEVHQRSLHHIKHITYLWYLYHELKQVNYESW
jgi:hypothetical protein